MHTSSSPIIIQVRKNHVERVNQSINLEHLRSSDHWLVGSPFGPAQPDPGAAFQAEPPNTSKLVLGLTLVYSSNSQMGAGGHPTHVEGCTQ